MYRIGPRVLPALCAALLAAPAGAAEHDTDRVLATVNGTPLSERMLQIYTRHRQSQQGARPEQAPNLLDDLVSLELLAQEAESQRLDATADLAAELALQRKNLLAQHVMQLYLRANPVEDAELRAAYDEAVARVYAGEFRVQHIQVEDKRRARELIDEIAAGADFAALAREHSEDPTGTDGGVLGWFSGGQLPPAMEAALDGLEPGTLVEQPVQTEHGWHVLRLMERRAQQAPSFEESRQTLRQVVQNRRLRDYVTTLREKAAIEMR